MPTEEEYVARVRKLGWPGLRKLWENIQARDTPGWEPGKAFEYLVLRTFELDGGTVRWPYKVGFAGIDEVEQIDGSVEIAGFYCLVESKDEAGDISIGAIAKLRNQLLRRPAGTLGLLFSSHRFTEPAVMLASFTMAQAVLLWKGTELGYVLQKKQARRGLEQKYRKCVDEGIPDFDIRTP